MAVDTEELLALAASMTGAARDLERIVAQLAGVRSGLGLSEAMRGIVDEIGKQVATTFELAARELEDESRRLGRRTREIGP